MEDSFPARRLGEDHRRDEVMDEGVVIGPGRHPIEPGAEELKFPVAEARMQAFQEKHGEGLFVQDRSAEQVRGGLQEEVEAEREDVVPKEARLAAQVRGAPAERADFAFEIALDAGGALDGTSFSEEAPEACGEADRIARSNHAYPPCYKN